MSMSPPAEDGKMMPEDLHDCTICGERAIQKAAFNAHIRAHLKEKLNTKLERRSEVARAAASPRHSPPPGVASGAAPKRKLDSCTPTTAAETMTPLQRKIKLELPEVLTQSMLPTLVELQVLEPNLSSTFPSPAASDAEITNFEDTLQMVEAAGVSQISSEFSHEMEMNRVDLNNDLSLILDQIEKDFEAPSLDLPDVHLETPPESDSETDLGLLSPPSCVLQDTLQPPVSDHDYMVRSIKQEPSPSPAPSPPSSTSSSSSTSPTSSPLSLAKFASLPAKAIAVLNQLPGKLVLQRSGADSAVVNVFKVEKVGSGASTASTLINIECVQEQARKGNMTNAKIIETTKGTDGEKEYKIVLGMERENRPSTKVTSVKSKQSADCNICGKSITTKNMARHMEKHTGKKKFHCEICQASFFQKTHLKNHIVLHENGDYHGCKECQQKFLRKADLQKHQKTIHHLDTSTDCNFSSGGQFLEPPPSKTKDRKELCGLCGEKFEDKESMIKHMEEHTSAIIDPSFTCSICQKSFAQKSHLIRHLKCHSAQSTTASSAEEGGDLECQVCGKLCPDSLELIRHHSKHFVCEVCASVFGTRTALQQHNLNCHLPAIDMPSSFLSPCSLSSLEDDFFEDDSNCSSSMMDSSSQDLFYNSPHYSPHKPASDSLSSFLDDLDSEGPLLTGGGQKTFAEGSLRQSLTLDDISDSSFFDISHQLDEELYTADLFGS